MIGSAGCSMGLVGDRGRGPGVSGDPAAEVLERANTGRGGVCFAWNDVRRC